MNEKIEYTDYAAVCQTVAKDTSDGWTRLFRKIEACCIAALWPQLVWKANGDVLRQVTTHFAAMQDGITQIAANEYIYMRLLSMG